MSDTSAATGALPFSGLLWDIDGTLADSEPVHRRSFLDACGALGINLPEDFHDSLVGQSEEAIYKVLRHRFGLGLGYESWAAQRHAAYLARIDEVTFIPLAREIWEAAAACGIPQGFVSNSPRVISLANLERLGLAGAGDVLVSRDDVNRGKPHPEPYRRGADRLSVSPGRAAAIEDSDAGRRAADAAGLTVFMMPHFAGARSPRWTPAPRLRDMLVQAAGQPVPPT